LDIWQKTKSRIIKYSDGSNIIAFIFKEVYMKLHIYYVQSEEEAKQIREQYKMIGEKVYVIISGKEKLKENLKDFLKSR
jgi:hypothetical protein